MRKIIIAVAATVAAFAPSIAAAEETRTFTDGGDTYVYTAKTRADGATVLRGHQVGGASFRLVVADGRVRGRSANRWVSFAAPKPAQVGAVSVAANN